MIPEVLQTSHRTVAIENGKKIKFQRANSSHERYWNAVLANDINGENCPQMVLFSLKELQNYLQEAEAEFERLEVPEKDRGIAILPVMHDGEQRFNIVFTPCVKDANNDCHHQFSPTNSVDIDPYEWLLEGLNVGGLQP